MTRGNCRLLALVIAVLFLGIFLRLYVATLGYNKDLVGAFTLVKAIEEIHPNIYALIKGGPLHDKCQSCLHTYGPVWAYSLYLIKQICRALGEVDYFRYAISFFLTLVDIGIAILLWRKFSLSSAIIFFLNPISIIISGYHSQFDNFAIWVAFLSLLVYEKKSLKETHRILLTSLLLGLSLSIKHVFLLFLPWLMFREKKTVNKLRIIFWPLFFFTCSFVPFIKERGIISMIGHVLLAASNGIAPLYSLLVPLLIRIVLPAKLFFIVSVIIMGYIFRKKNLWQSFVLYCASLVMFSSAILNHYLAIPTLFVAVYPNLFNIAYLVMGTAHLLFHRHGLGLPNPFYFITYKGHPVIGSSYSTPSFAIVLFLLLLGYLFVLYPHKGTKSHL